MDQIKAVTKYVLSYAKTTWVFEDYPIRTWKNPNAREANVTYGAGITNWMGLVGHGETREKALEQLRERFETRTKNKQGMPRPGTKVPFKFSSTENIDRYKDIGVDFLHRIFGLDYNKGFYSDESDLMLFILRAQDHEKAKEAVINRVLLAYEIDINDIWDGPLWKILQAIKEKRST